MTRRLVKPYSAWKETGAVALATVLILAVGGVMISQRQQIDTMPRLYDWQLSAFYDLNETDRAIYNSLITAADELWWLHGDKLAYNVDILGDPWPTVEELETYYVLPPFPQDLFWETHGAVTWQRVASFSFEGSTVYHGSGGDIPDQSAYLLSLSHVHKGASYADGAFVWVHENPDAPPPENVVRDTLIREGWREVLPYSGAMEVNRLRGTRR